MDIRLTMPTTRNSNPVKGVVKIRAGYRDPETGAFREQHEGTCDANDLAGYMRRNPRVAAMDVVRLG